MLKLRCGRATCRANAKKTFEVVRFSPHRKPANPSARVMCSRVVPSYRAGEQRAALTESGKKYVLFLNEKLAVPLLSLFHCVSLKVCQLSFGMPDEYYCME